MRILYFSFVELDIPNACQTHTLGVLSGISKNLCGVDAVVPRPKRVRPKIPGVRFYFLWPWRFSAGGRLWIKILSGVVFFVLCSFRKYDAIYVRELGMNPIPRWCSLLFKIPLFIEVNSILLQNMQTDGIDPRKINRAKRCQAADFQHASGLIVPSFPRCRWIIDHYGLRPGKVHMVLNGMNVPERSKIDRATVLQTFGLPQDGLYLGFLGTVWRNYDLWTVIKAMELCRNSISQLHLLVIGEGPALGQLLRLAEANELTSKVITFGYVQPDRLGEVIGAFDIGLMNMTSSGLEDLGPVTTRFATYAAFRTPVIANTPHLEHYPNELNQGLATVPPEDPHALAAKITWLHHHPEERMAKAEILHDFAMKQLSWDSVTRRILDIIKAGSSTN